MRIFRAQVQGRPDLKANEFVFMSKISRQEVMASFTTPYSEELWQSLARRSSQPDPDESKQGASKLLVFGPALPEGEDDRIAHLMVHVHEDEDDEVEADAEEMTKRPMLHWILVLVPKPSGEPPEAIKAENAKIGGRQGLIKMLEEIVPSPWTRAARFRIQCVLSRLDWICRVLPPGPVQGTRHDMALRLGTPAYMEQIGYRYENGANGLSEVAIIYQHEENDYAVTIRGNGLLRLEAESWLPYADELVNMITDAFFTKPATAEGTKS